MAYDFREFEYEREPQASSARGGGPPRHRSVAGVLDLPLPPGAPHAAPASGLVTALGVASLAGLAIYALVVFFRHR
jgi:hypothetical protein